VNSIEKSDPYEEEKTMKGDLLLILLPFFVLGLFFFLVLIVLYLAIKGELNIK